MSSHHTAIFNNNKSVLVKEEFKNLYQGHEFCDYLKKKIRKLIDEHAFYNIILNKIVNSESIKKQVKQQAKNLKEELNRELNDKIRRELSSAKKDLKELVPSLVAEQLSKQIGLFLNDHQKMNSILEEHIRNLNFRLSNTAYRQQESLKNTLINIVKQNRKILDDMVKEDKYHIMTDKYLKEIQSRNSTTINKMLNDYNSTKKNIKNSSDKLAQKMKQNCKDTMSELKLKLENVKMVKTQITNLTGDIDKLHRRLNGLTNLLRLLGVFCGGMMGILIYLVVHRK